MNTPFLVLVPHTEVRARRRSVAGEHTESLPVTEFTVQRAVAREFA
jgi:hypothetical protein